MQIHFLPPEYICGDGKVWERKAENGLFYSQQIFHLKRMDVVSVLNIFILFDNAFAVLLNLNQECLRFQREHNAVGEYSCFIAVIECGSN